MQEAITYIQQSSQQPLLSHVTQISWTVPQLYPNTAQENRLVYYSQTPIKCRSYVQLIEWIWTINVQFKLITEFAKFLVFKHVHNMYINISLTFVVDFN